VPSALLPESTVRVGIHSGQQHSDYARYEHLWRRADELGLDWASAFDHFVPILSDPAGPCFEGLTLLSAMAARTQRIRCGILVVGNTYRHPAVLANAAATIDHVSGGRLELGLGAGWFELEHDQYGIPFPSIGERLARLGEAARIVKSLWTEEETTFQGRYYTLDKARCEPKPAQRPHPPLWIGGTGERVLLRIAAESADGWNTFVLPEDEYRQKLAALARHCAELGRDPSEIRKSLIFRVVLGENEAEAEQCFRERAMSLGLDPDELRAQGFEPLTPEQCAELFGRYQRLGVRDFLVMARPPADERTMELLVQRVAPALRA
jgi:F420-dependent oxidoreductase-like protein